MATLYEGWEGSILYGAETTPGTGVATTLPFGVTKNYNTDTSASLEEEGAIGTPYPVSLEEGIEEVSGSCEFLPVAKTAILLGKRNGSGKLSSYSIFSGAGPGIKQVGCKINQMRFVIEPGGRLRATMDWFALGSVDNAAVAAVIPTDETMNWIKCETNLSSEVAGMEFSINHNLSRRAVVMNASTTMPVTGQNRTAYAIKEGRQSVKLTARFFERPSENVIADIITELSSTTLTCTGQVGGSPVAFVFTLSNGKPGRRSHSAADSGEALWPVEFTYKTWDVADVG